MPFAYYGVWEMANPELERLAALLEEHGIVPERGTAERGAGPSWWLTHTYILQEVEKADDFPMSVEEVRAILERRFECPICGAGHSRADHEWLAAPPTGSPYSSQQRRPPSAYELQRYPSSTSGLTKRPKGTLRWTRS